ncbi:dockerin type I repeat-containing protein [Anthocerotibacter panamensis]|uniref:dockerin type I repeat-containing protein n=1 Tax=Anthocerotibacter panamensis TaxID=2857077 RepID=UPI001C4015F4|nr:dockerin type I repeat-containing protein [Anthocerotibacter panamensis]
MKFHLVVAGTLLLYSLPLAAKAAGDINGDSRVDQTDLTVLENYLKGAELFSDSQTAQADLNGDGQVDVRDINVLRQRLGLALVPEPAPPSRTFDAKADQKLASQSQRGRGKPSFDLNVADVVPEWVRGAWSFRSRVVDDFGFDSLNRVQPEQITLPGDLSGLYVTVKTSTGERLDRVCWQVNQYSDDRFSFTEQVRDRQGAIYSSTSVIENRGAGQAQITIRTEILDAGRPFTSFGNERRGGLGGLFGLLFGSPARSFPSEDSLRVGYYNVRTGLMLRQPGSEQKRLQDIDLNKLRCR